jgi:hypothetical protein
MSTSEALYADQGCSFSSAITVHDGNNEPFDLTTNFLNGFPHNEKSAYIMTTNDISKVSQQKTNALPRYYRYINKVYIG